MARPSRPQTGHAHHFLSRLDRVAPPEVELALSLYNDAPLLKTVLETVRLPERAERVAISIDDPVEGPFVIVTRDGKFVTCLGRGMSPGDHPVVTRAQLDGITRSVQELKARIEAATKLTGPGKGHSLISRVLTGGADVTREEFLAVSAWAPLMTGTYLQLLARLQKAMAEAQVDLFTIRTPRPYDTAPLRAYWTLSWAIAHITMLLGMHGRWLFERIRQSPEKKEGGIERLIPLFAHGACRDGVTAMAARGLWAVGKIGKPLLGPYKHAYAASEWIGDIFETGSALIIMGQRHFRLRAEARKALAMAKPNADDDTRGWSAAIVRVADWIAESHDELDAWHLSSGRLMCVRIAQQRANGRPIRFTRPEDVPDDVARVCAINQRGHFVGVWDDYIALARGIPWLSRASAEELYLPADAARELKVPWTPQTTMEMLDDQRDFAWQPEPVIAPVRPERNAPCSCGSGKKYKRCCGA